MKKYLKLVLALTVTTLIVVSCDTDSEFDIPQIKQILLFEGFEGTTTGAGANEVAIALEGWSNFAVNPLGTRKWHSRIFSGNKYAEFSSFFSTASSADEAWLVTPEITLNASKQTILAFDTKIRFWTGSNLTVLISENYDGTQNGIATATWTSLNPTLPTSTQVDVFVPSGNIDLSAYKGKVVKIAFKYVGSKTANLTTTYQLDNIKLFEN
jgi:Domain of unknown function (DUF5017)